MKVKSFLIHPDWDVNLNTYDADIAIVELELNVQFNEFIQPICLIEPTSEAAKVSKTFSTFFINNENTIPRLPQESILEKCSMSVYYEKIISKASSYRTLCSKYLNDSKYCYNYAGNGFYVQLKGRYFLRGIYSTSFLDSSLVCDYQIESIITDVSKFYYWIITKGETNTQNQNLDFSFQNGYNSKKIVEPFVTII